MRAKETKLTIPGPTGGIEAILEEIEGPSKLAIVSHPNPEHGGTMQNKVVTTVARALRLSGLSTLRYNYRGVGASEGTFAEGIGETDDLIKVIEWCDAEGLKPEVLAGFSFGTFVTLNAMRQLANRDFQACILVAPPVHFFKYDFERFPDKTLVVQCEDDEVVPADKVFDWVEGEGDKLQLIRYREAGHFFHGRLIELREDIIKWLQE